MPEYTGGETVTLTAGQTLVGPSTIANINSTGQDAYARQLIVSNATVGTVNISSGGTMFMRGADASAESISVYGYYGLGNKQVNYDLGGRLWMSGGVVNTLTLDNEGTCSMYGGEIKNLLLSRTSTGVMSSVKFYIYGGTVLGGSNAANAGAKEIYANGGLVSNFTMNASAYIFASNGGCFKDCTFSGTWFAIRGGTAERVTFLNARNDSHNRMSTGLMSDCTIAAGASYAMIGGKAEKTVLSGANARFLVSGANAVFSSGTISSGGSLSAVAGTLKDTLVLSGGTLTASGTAGAKVTVNGVTVDGNGGVSGAVFLTNAAANNVTVSSGAQLIVYAGTTLTDLHIRGNTNGSTEKAEIPYIYVMDNGKVVGGETENRGYHFIASAGGVIENFTANSGGYLYIAGVKTDDTWNRAIFSGGVIKNANFEVRGGLAVNATVSSGGVMLFTRVKSGIASKVTIEAGGSVILTSGGTMTDCTIRGSKASGALIRDGVVSNITILNAAQVIVSGGGVVYNPTVSASESPGTLKTRLEVSNGGYVSGGYAGNPNNYTMEVYIRQGANVSAMTFGSGAFVLLAGTAKDCVVSRTGGQQVTLRPGGGVSGTFLNGKMYAGAKMSVSAGVVSNTLIKSGASVWCMADANKVQHAELNDVTVEFGGSVWLRNTGSGGQVGLMSGGLMCGSLYISNNGIARDVTIGCSGSATIYSGGVASGAVINNKGIVIASSAGIASGTTVNSGGRLYLYSSGAASNTVVRSGGTVYLAASGAMLVDLNAEAGAIVSARVGSGATIERPTALMNDASNMNGTLILSTADKEATYTIAQNVGNTNLTVSVPWLMYDNTVSAGEVYVNPFLGKRGKFSVSEDGKTFSTAKASITSVAEAKSVFVNGDVLGTKLNATVNANDRAAIWNGDTFGTVTESVAIAEDADAECGDVWMATYNPITISAPLYGAAKRQNFANTVNFYFQPGTVVTNLAAGADYGGSVGGVNIFVAKATFSGVAYAGGFGTVDDDVKIQISYADTDIQKDFYAGALFNASKLENLGYTDVTQTSVGDITMTVSNGTFDGNVYGASAVKAGTITTVENQAALHTVDNVTLTISYGTATKGVQACVFAGGYATGHDTAKLAPVYTVGSVTATIAGGSWGEACGGRGIFGGAFASDNIASGTEAAGVWAQVGNVNLTISGGTMGNVYGGGWAQKGAKSEVGNVNITISGGTVANVFGGGSTSTSGGTTVAGDVTITVSGGSITGDIYARGQSSTDSTGNAAVVFTGGTAFGCGVYGYSYVGGEESDATLSFSDYTATFSGKVGGFAGITLDGATTMTLTAEADINNAAWTFDLADRVDWLNNTSLLTWTAEAGFTGDKVVVNFADADQAAAGWSIAAANFTGATFDLCIDDTTVAGDLAYDTAISGGDWDGWKFTSVDGTLKFAKLA